MRDRDIAVGYQNVKSQPFETIGMYTNAYKRLKESASLPGLGKVICLNDNFGINSVVKTVLGCSQYDIVVLNGTHQRYCFNVCKDALEVDSFYTSQPYVENYDTVIIDGANISDEEFAELVNSVDESQNMITIYDGLVVFYSPDDNLNHVPVTSVLLNSEDVKGQRVHDNIVSDFDIISDEGAIELKTVSDETRVAGNPYSDLSPQNDVVIGVDPANVPDRSVEVQPYVDHVVDEAVAENESKHAEEVREQFEENGVMPDELIVKDGRENDEDYRDLENA